jgi:aconitate decarboxylase
LFYLSDFENLSTAVVDGHASKSPGRRPVTAPRSAMPQQESEMHDRRSSSTDALPTAGATEQLSRFLARTTYDQLPGAVIERTKHLILDGVGCGLLAARLDWSERAVETLKALDGEGTATVWGWNLKLPPMTAALLNGTFVQGFELDDYHPFGPLHSQACVLPAVLGTAEPLGSVDGRHLLEAVALGFEIGPRIGMAMGGLQLVTRGWHCGAVYGVLGAVAGAGKIRRLNQDQFESAIGNAATQACGLMSAQYEAMVKRMHSGLAARSGVLAAALAGAGFTGIRRVLERDFGGFAATFCGPDPFDLRRLTDDLGSRWEVMRIAVKPPYSAMAGTHSAIEGALELRETAGFRVDAIKAIRVGVVEAMLHHGGFELERPATPIGAQMSHRYVVAVTLLDGSPSVPQFSPQRIDRDDVWKLMERIEVYRDENIESRGEAGRWGTKLTATFLDGTSREIEVSNPKGGPQRPFSNDEIIEKYDKLTSMVMAPLGALRLKEEILTLERAKDIKTLSNLLAEEVVSPF